SKPKGHRGCPAGSAGYQKGKEWILVKAVGKHKPHSKPGWRKATKHYNSKVQKERQQEWDILKNKWNCMVKRKKPTGDGEGSKLHNAVLEAEEQQIAQEETAVLDNNGWSDLDVAPANKAQPSLKKPCVKSEPHYNTLAPAPAPAPPPFARSKAVCSMSASQTIKPDVIDISSDSDTSVCANVTPAKRKAHPDAKTKPGVTYYATKAPQGAEIKKAPDTRRKDAQSQQSTALSRATGLTKVKLFGHDRIIEQLEKELTLLKERCHQLERQADSVTMAMTMYGIPLSEEASGAAGGPSIGISLARFLRDHFSPTASVSSLTYTTTATALLSADVVPPTSDNIPIDPALYEAMDHNHAEDVPEVSNMPSGLNLSISEKGKLPMFPGY
ncbi:unnamed protein product, partial [Rhizoctonia solani]